MPNGPGAQHRDASTVGVRSRAAGSPPVVGSRQPDDDALYDAAASGPTIPMAGMKPLRRGIGR